VALLFDSVAVLLADSKGVFPQTPSVYSFLGRPAAPAGAYTELFDVNGDDRADVVSDGGDGKLYVLLNLGNGTFATAPLLSPSLLASTVSSADVNLDGRQDLIVGSTAGSLGFLLNRGNGSFHLVANSGGSLMGSGLLFPVSLDGDSRLDLLAYSGGLSIPFRNTSR
jgi:hypothetical protein